MLALDVAALLQAGCDSDLVSIRGVVLRNGLDAAQGSLFIASAERVVEVALSGSFDMAQCTTMARELALGKDLELTGVAELQSPMQVTGTVNRIGARRLTVLEKVRAAANEARRPNRPGGASQERGHPRKPRIAEPENGQGSSRRLGGADRLSGRLFYFITVTLKLSTARARASASSPTGGKLRMRMR